MDDGRWEVRGERSLALEWPGVLRLDGLASGKLSEVVSSPRAWKGVAALGRVWRVAVPEGDICQFASVSSKLSRKSSVMALSPGIRDGK